MYSAVKRVKRVRCKEDMQNIIPLDANYLYINIFLQIKIFSM